MASSCKPVRNWTSSSIDSSHLRSCFPTAIAINDQFGGVISPHWPGGVTAKLLNQHLQADGQVLRPAGYAQQYMSVSPCSTPCFRIAYQRPTARRFHSLSGRSLSLVCPLGYKYSYGLIMLCCRMISLPSSASSGCSSSSAWHQALAWRV